MSTLHVVGSGGTVSRASLPGASSPVHEDEDPEEEKTGLRHRRFQWIIRHPAVVVKESARQPHILSGYRTPTSLKQGLMSLFLVHNQTINVWTHLIGFMYFLWVTPITLTDALARGTSTDAWMFFWFLSSAQSCMLFSALFHLLGCASDRWFETFYALDLLGIASLILGSFAIGVYQGFYCQRFYIVLYIGTVMFGVAACGYLAVNARYRSPTYDPLRKAVFVATVAFAVVPLGHWWFSCPDHTGARCNRVFLEYCLGMLAFYLSGFVIYATRFPENFAPGQFDLFMASHQWWHLLVLAAALIWYFGNVQYFQRRTSEGPEVLCAGYDLE